MGSFNGCEYRSLDVGAGGWLIGEKTLKLTSSKSIPLKTPSTTIMNAVETHGR